MDKIIGDELKKDTKIANSKDSESSFDYWQQTAAYSIKQYKLGAKMGYKRIKLRVDKKLQ